MQLILQLHNNYQLRTLSPEKQRLLCTTTFTVCQNVYNASGNILVHKVHINIKCISINGLSYFDLSC